MTDKARIVCAANLNQDGVIVLGARHFDSLMHTTIKAQKLEGSDWVQGFITNRGDFVDRKEAWVVASRAGQIIHRCGGEEETLYSENLY